MAVDRRREYEIERTIDRLVEASDLEEQHLPLVYDDVRQAAMAILSAEAKGVRVSYPMLVVLYEVTTTALDTGSWRYRAIPAARANGLQGCRHDVDAADFRWAQAAAVAEHRLTCVGRGDA